MLIPAWAHQATIALSVTTAESVCAMIWRLQGK
jgi:hypothetical protein